MGTERGLLMLSPRPRLILPSSMAPMAMATTHSAMDTDMGMPDTLMLTMVTTTARGPLMLSPTTATTAMVPGPTTATTVWDTTVWATGDTSGDKFSPAEVESRSSKRTSLLVI